MATDKGKEPAQEEQKRKSHGRRFFKKQEGERKEGGVPLLKYGKGNNFYAFQQALYRNALRDYGDLAKIDHPEQVLRARTGLTRLHRIGIDDGGGDDNATRGAEGTFKVTSKDETRQTQVVWADPRTHECGEQG